MTTFSTDVELLTWEPALMREFLLDNQCLVRGTGASTEGTTVTATGAGFAAAHVRPGHVIHLLNQDQGVDAYYAVLTVEGEGSLLASLIGSTPATAAPLPSATDLDYAIYTFDPQHEEARDALLARFGLDTDPLDAAGDLERWIFRRGCLRRASTALVLAMIYRGQTAAGPDSSALARKADHYARVYEDEVVKARVALDRDGDGRPDDVRSLASHRLRRD